MGDRELPALPGVAPVHRGGARLPAQLVVRRRRARGHAEGDHRSHQRDHRRLHQATGGRREVARPGRDSDRRSAGAARAAPQDRAGALSRGHCANRNRNPSNRRQSTRAERLAVARFWYEGNAFGPLPADLRRFERCEWTSGPQALAAARGTATELGAVAAFAQQHPEWEVVSLRCASALPGGPIDDAVFERFAAELRDGLAAGPWDAVYLSLHGAAITARRQTPDLDLVRTVRALLPDVPLGASFDLHGNMAPDSRRSSTWRRSIARIRTPIWRRPPRAFSTT